VQGEWNHETCATAKSLDMAGRQTGVERLESNRRHECGLSRCQPDVLCTLEEHNNRRSFSKKKKKERNYHVKEPTLSRLALSSVYSDSACHGWPMSFFLLLLYCIPLH
jgi:hypothetical protein